MRSDRAIRRHGQFHTLNESIQLTIDKLLTRSHILCIPHGAFTLTLPFPFHQPPSLRCPSLSRLLRPNNRSPIYPHHTSPRLTVPCINTQVLPPAHHCHQPPNPSQPSRPNPTHNQHRPLPPHHLLLIIIVIAILYLARPIHPSLKS